MHTEYKSAERLAEQEAASAQIATLQLELEAAATRAKGLEAKVSELKEAAAAAQQQQQQQQQSVGAEVEGEKWQGGRRCGIVSLYVFCVCVYE
jgi:predicted  nucleic acid-binding Zn-ribbon protein